MRIHTILGALFYLALSVVMAHAQSALLQGGPWKAGRAPMYVGNGFSQPIVQDSGPSSGGGPGVNLEELGVTSRGGNNVNTPPYANNGNGPLGEHFCMFDAPTTNPTGYHYFCFDPNAQGGGLIDYGAAGSAAPLPLQFSVNGVLFTLPTSGGSTNVPIVTSTAALAATTTASSPFIERVGLTTAGDSPAVVFTAFNAACTVNGGAGDVGSQVPSVDGKCWVANYAGQCVQMMAFGFNGTSGADNSGSFTAAYNAAGRLNVNCVDLPTTTFDMAAVTLSAYNNVVFHCAAAGNAASGTLIRPTSLTETLITVNTLSGIYFKGCSFKSPSQQTAGSFVYFLNSNDSGLSDYLMENGYDSLYLNNSGNLHFSGHGQIRSWAHNGVTVNGSEDYYFTQLIMDQDGANTPNACFYVPQSGGSLVISDSDLLHCHHGVWVNPGLNQFVNWIYISNTFFDTCDSGATGGNGVNITPTNGAIVNGFFGQNLWTSTCTQGINAVADSLSTISNITLSNHHALNNKQHALNLFNVADVADTNMVYAGNGTAATGSYSAVLIDGSHSTNNNFLGGRIGSPVEGYAATQAFAFQWTSAMVGVISVNGVNMEGNASGGVAPGGNQAAASMVVNSPGYNPVGSSVASPTSSPWTYTAGLSPETLSLVGTGITVTYPGSLILCAAVTTCTAPLTPEQPVVITYSTITTSLVTRQ